MKLAFISPGLTRPLVFIAAVVVWGAPLLAQQVESILIVPARLGSVDAGASPEGIETSATRTLTLAAEEAQFSAGVTVPYGVTLDQVLQKLSGTGIQPGDLISRSGPTNSVPVPSGVAATTVETFAFRFNRPFADLKSMVAVLYSAGGADQERMTVSYSVAAVPSQATIDSLRETVQPQLVADARRKAQVIADGAGLQLAGVEGVDDGSGGGVYAVLGNFVVPAYRVLVGVVIYDPLSGVASSTLPVTYSARVRFAVR